MIKFGERPKNLYLINEGKVTVFDSKTSWKVLSYIIGSYFGDI